MADNFEKTFSQLVEARLKETAPFLMKYAVGFEIKDRDEDGSKGFGVYAFLIGTVPAYVPVVYNKGSIDGFECLWLADQRLMVPAVSNWVSTVKDRGQGLFGQILKKPDVRVKAVHQPEGIVLDSATFPYAIKTASEDGGFVGSEIITGMLGGTPSDARVGGGLEAYLADNPDALAVICKTAVEDADFADALQSIYGGTGILKELVTKAKDNLVKKAEEDKKTPVATKGVKVITDINDPDSHLLSSAEKRKLMKTGSFILDTREEHTPVFKYKLASETVTNPAETGFCRALQLDGSFKDVWVTRVKFPEDNGKLPETEGYHTGQVVVVPRDEPGTGYVFPYQEVFVTDMGMVDEFEVGEKATKEKFMPLARVGDRLDENPGGYHKIMPEYLEGIGLCDSSEGMVYTIRLASVEDNPGGLTVIFSGMPAGTLADKCRDKKYHVTFTDKEGKGFTIGHSQVQIGPETRTLKICNRYGAPFRLGEPEGFNQDIIKNAGLSELKITCDGPAVSTRLDDRYHGISTEEREFRRIVFDMGVEPGAARQMIKTAREDEEGEIKYLLKLGGPYEGAVENLQKDPETAVVREQTPEITVIEGAREHGVLLTEARQTAVDAAESGNKDLFEITALKGLMEVLEDNSMRRESFIKYLRGMDECGRGLFRIFWKKDDMKKQYGSEDTERLENALRDNFNSMGELVLFLQNKFTRLHGPFENSMDGLLAEDIGEIES